MESSSRGGTFLVAGRDHLAQQAVESAGDAIVTVDSTGRITSWNAAAVRLFGYPEQAAIGQTLALIVPQVHRARHVAAFHAAIERRELAQDGRPALVEGVAADGSVIPLEMTLGLLRDEAGQRSGVVSVLRVGATTPISFV
jgi:PAS domain S-box-containing protein